MLLTLAQMLPIALQDANGKEANKPYNKSYQIKLYSSENNRETLIG